MKNKFKLIALFLILAALMSAVGCELLFLESDTYGLNIYFIDVGQGDSILVESPNKKYMLIDTGTYSSYTKLSSFLDSKGITSLDVVVATHPHADHIGSMASVLKDYGAKSFYLPDAQADTKTYRLMMDTALELDIEPTLTWAETVGELPFDDDMSVRVVSPHVSGDYDELNDYSIALSITYGEISVLLTGDMEEYAETVAMALTSGDYLDADILKVGHHGSKTSSSPEFIEAVSPRLAIISVGYDNSYGNPHPKTIETLESQSIPYLMTMDEGTIHICIDGNDFFIVE